MKLMLKLLCGASCALVLFPAPADAGGRAQYAVNARADTPDANPGDGMCADAVGRCTLRAAAMEAAMKSGQVIVTLNGGTYLLTRAGASEDDGLTGDLDVPGKLVIRGNGATINARDLDRVFDVRPRGAGDGLFLDDVTLLRGVAPDGESGGAVRNNGGLLTIVNSTIALSRAEGAGGSGGGVFNDGGTFTSSNTLYARNRASRAGGAIEANGGDTDLEGVEMRDNFAGAAPGNGGAFHLTGAGTVRVENANVYNNEASAEGGGLWNSAGGDMRIYDSFIADNIASGDAADQGGGGLFNDGGTMWAIRTRIERNVATGAAGSGGGIFNNAGVLYLSGTTVRVNSASRAGGGIEANAGSTTIVGSKLVSNNVGASPGNGGGFHLTGAGQVSVRASYIADNSASAEGGGLWNSAGGNFEIEDSAIYGNVASGDAADQGGGGVFNDGGTLRLIDSVLRDNRANGASGSGGGLLTVDGSVTVRRTEFAFNSASRAGGGAEVIDGGVQFSGVFMLRNQTGAAPGNGGGIHVTGGGTVVNVFSSHFAGNFAAREGGALWNNGGTMRVLDTVIRDNRASGDAADDGGGGIFNNGGTMDIGQGTRIKRNIADGVSGSGGGIFNNDGDVTVTDCRIDNNVSNRAGGGIEALAGTTTLVDVILSDNNTGNAPGNGGGFHLTGAGLVDIDRGRVIRNNADNEGGGLWNSATGTMRVDGTLINTNTAPTGPNVFTQPGGTLIINGVPQ